ncbi:MAG: bifunctional nuclease family protein [Thermoguttaceae bacterium]|nr:bifunctional nuclease family protein [Thermoguttaceae bacterium]
MRVQVELARVVICEFNSHQAVFLREKGGQRELAIAIAPYEAALLDRRVRGLPSARPLTHDLLAQVIRAVGAEAKEVRIVREEHGVYYAELLVDHGAEQTLLDTRPSDALILAFTEAPPLPIFVAEELFGDAPTDFQTETDQ